MVKKMIFLIVLVSIIALCSSVVAGPPLPLHSLEGVSGVQVTSTAYLANPPEDGKTFGKPSFSVSAIWGSEKDVQSFAVTENIGGKIELGYASMRLGLGDFPEDVKTATGGAMLHHGVKTVLG